jgi:hypothetical protein
MDLNESRYLSLVENGHKGPVTAEEAEDMRYMCRYMRDHTTFVPDTKNEEPCGLLIKELKKTEKYSKDFVVLYLCEEIGRGCIWVENFIFIIKLYNIFDPDSSYSSSEIKLLETIISAIQTYIKRDRYHNYLEIEICDCAFEEIMIYLKDVIDRGGQIIIDHCHEFYLDLLSVFQYEGRALPFRWITAERDLNGEGVSLSHNPFFSPHPNALSSMIETTYRMFKFPDLYDEKSEKLWIERRACEKLKKKYQSMVLFYTKLFGGGYRKIDTELTRENLPSEIVEYLLTFLGLNEVDYDLRSGRF